MQFIQGEIYHVFNRGNNKQPIFYTRDNYIFFLKKIRRHLVPHCEVIAHCLMPNHFHLLIFIKTDKDTHLMTGSHRMRDNVTEGIAILLRSYTRALQNQEHFTGSLFQQKTKARKIDNDKANYTINNLLIYMDYIHQNPIKARLAKSIEEWEFSSYRDYAKLRSGSLCNKNLGFDLTGLSESDFKRVSFEIARYNPLDFFKTGN